MEQQSELSTSSGRPHRASENTIHVSWSCDKSNVNAVSILDQNYLDHVSMFLEESEESDFTDDEEDSDADPNFTLQNKDNPDSSAEET